MMNKCSFHGDVGRLRSPQRLATLEVDDVVALSLEGCAPANVLDVGTGTGVFAEVFAGCGLEVAGVDVSAEMIALARQFVPQGRFQVAPTGALPFADGAFDLVFLGLVLHEAEDGLLALQEAYRVSRQRVAILEWPYMDEAKIDGGPPLAKRLPQERVEALARAAGFEAFESLPLTHTVVYRLER